MLGSTALPCTSWPPGVGTGRLRRFVLFLLLPLLLLSACAPRSPVVLLTHLTPNDPVTREDVVLSRILEELASAQPEIAVQVRTEPWDTVATVFFETPSEDRPDLVWFPSRDLPRFTQSRALRPAADLLGRRWMDEHASDLFVPPATSAAVSLEAYGLLYRADLLAASGLNSRPTSWEELADAASSLTGYDDYIYSNRHGLGIGMDSGDRPVPAVVPLALAAGAEAPLAPLRRLTASTALHPEFLTHTPMEVFRGFVAGRFAMALASTSLLPRLFDESVVADPTDLRFMAIPAVGGGSAPVVVDAWHLGVHRGSRQNRRTGRFVRFLLSAEADRIRIDSGAALPLRRSSGHPGRAGAHDDALWLALTAAGRAMDRGMWSAATVDDRDELARLTVRVLAARETGRAEAMVLKRRLHALLRP